MTPAFLGIALWLLLAATAWKYSTIRLTLHRYDRIGAFVFFIVIGLPVIIAGWGLIAKSTI
jgi:hypothetical protein